jgi:hypothetical protein
MRDIPGLADKLLVSQAGLCRAELGFYLVRWIFVQQSKS